MLSNSSAVAARITQDIPKQTILVAGDIMLDRYMWGKVERISPEAPVPVVHLENETLAAGGAANVARNLVALGAAPILLGWIGADADGKTLRTLLEHNSIDTRYAVRGARRTTVKTRIVGGHQHMVRIDSEDATTAGADEETELIAAAQRAFTEQNCTAVLISDYGKGVVSEKFCQFLISEAARRGIPVLVDPKGWDYSKYRGATALCPNRGELAQAVGGGKFDLETLLEKGTALRSRLHLQFLVATLSELGIALIDSSAEVFPAQTREVFDVSGAGDTVIATLTAAIAAGFAPRDAVILANIAAGVVVGKIGTVPITAQELLAEVASTEQREQTRQRIYTRTELEPLVLQWKQQGERIVFTNGCFDLLHVGHIRLLQEAKALGTKLVVAINSDASVQRLKGPERPIVRERDRAEILSHLSSVDAVLVFDEDTPLEAIQAIRPQILVKGSDYTEATVVGADLVKSWGGRVHLIPLVDGISTTGTVKKIRRAEAAQKK
jgi:D-beta-D-heptose 7-phosphate kinase/D-beta-D-heptose 1-phosphate adenosyltransferase